MFFYCLAADKTTEREFRAKSPLSKLSVLTRVSRRTHKVSGNNLLPMNKKAKTKNMGCESRR